MFTDERNSAFRKLEAELDRYYQTSPFFGIAPERAVYALMVAFDSLYFLEPLLTPTTEYDISLVQLRNSHEEGLSQALRWILGKTMSVDPVVTTDEHLMGDAFHFIEMAGNYHLVETFHVMHGKGWVDVSVDLTTKSVRFDPPTDRNVRRTMAGYEDVLGNGQTAHPLGMRDRDLKAHRLAVRQIHALNFELLGGRVVLKDLAQLNHPAIAEYQDSFRVEFEDMPHDADLVGFSVEQFHRYWLALGRWSRCLVYLYFRNAQSGISQTECMPTQCVSKDEFIDGLCILSGLDKVTTQVITNRLTWGGSIGRPDIFLQPLLVGPNAVCWSTRVTDLSKYPRNMLKLMAKMKGPTKKVADNLIGQREVPAAIRDLPPPVRPVVMLMSRPARP